MGQRQFKLIAAFLVVMALLNACSIIGETTMTLRVIPVVGGTVSTDIDGDGKLELSCGTQTTLCSLELSRGSTLELSAEADDKFAFEAWQGCASQTAACQLSVDAATTVSASFVPVDGDPIPSDPVPDDPPPVLYNLDIVFVGTGAGTVTDGSSLNCGAACSATYPADTELSLEAVAAEDSSFNGWGEACNSISEATCTLKLTQDTVLEVDFELETYRLSVELTGSGSGAVRAESGAIDCQPDCEASFTAGTAVTLRAVADEGSSFAAWQGCPEAEGAVCAFALAADTTVSAKFDVLSGAEKTIKVPIRRGSDDAEEYLKAVTVNTSKYSESFPKNGVDIKSGDIDLIHDRLTDADQIVGLRFSRLDIPKNALVTKAYIQFQSDQDYSNRTPTTLYLEGEASAKAKPFVHQSVGTISARPKVRAAAVRWQPGLWGGEGAAGANERSPDLSAIVQELVDYSDWDRADNAIVLIISGEGYRAATSYEDADGQAQLVVSYR